MSDLTNEDLDELYPKMKGLPFRRPESVKSIEETNEEVKKKLDKEYPEMVKAGIPDRQ